LTDAYLFFPDSEVDDDHGQRRRRDDMKSPLPWPCSLFVVVVVNKSNCGKVTNDEDDMNATLLPPPGRAVATVAAHDR
jgi:hypothetical protein